MRDRHDTILKNRYSVLFSKVGIITHAAIGIQTDMHQTKITTI